MEIKEKAKVVGKFVADQAVDLAKEEATKTTTLVRSGCWLGMAIIVFVIVVIGYFIFR